MNLFDYSKLLKPDVNHTNAIIVPPLTLWTQNGAGGAKEDGEESVEEAWVLVHDVEQL